jgi:hypothetical protein
MRVECSPGCNQIPRIKLPSNDRANAPEKVCAMHETTQTTSLTARVLKAINAVRREVGDDELPCLPKGSRATTVNISAFRIGPFSIGYTT